MSARTLGAAKAALLTLALAGCGKVAELRPAPGHALPPRPALADHQPDAAELLTPPPFAAPARVDELMKRSEPRKADRFDLPPPSGGLAPMPSEAATEPAPLPATPEDTPRP